MRRDQLEHAIRTACQIIGHPDIIVVGSQTILGSIVEEELPPAATMSMEVDVLPIAANNDEAPGAAIAKVVMLAAKTRTSLPDFLSALFADSGMWSHLVSAFRCHSSWRLCFSGCTVAPHRSQTDW